MRLKTLDESTNRQKLLDDIVRFILDSIWTPLAETLYEAGLYFQGAAELFQFASFHLFCKNLYKPNSILLSEKLCDLHDGWNFDARTATAS